MNHSFPNKRIRIIHASVFKLYRQGVKSCMDRNESFEWIGEAENGTALLDMLEHVEPDVILLDIRLWGLDGLETLPLIKQRFPAIKVIMLSMQSDPEIILRTLELGANGYLTGDSCTEDIYNAIFASFQPGIFLSRVARHTLSPSFDAPTKKELMLLRLLANNICEEEIALELDLSIRTIKAVIAKLFRASNTFSIGELLDCAREKKFI